MAVSTTAKPWQWSFRKTTPSNRSRETEQPQPGEYRTDRWRGRPASASGSAAGRDRQRDSDCSSTAVDQADLLDERDGEDRTDLLKVQNVVKRPVKVEVRGWKVRAQDRGVVSEKAVPRISRRLVRGRDDGLLNETCGRSFKSAPGSGRCRIQDVERAPGATPAGASPRRGRAQRCAHPARTEPEYGPAAAPRPAASARRRLSVFTAYTVNCDRHRIETTPSSANFRNPAPPDGKGELGGSLPKVEAISIRS